MRGFFKRVGVLIGLYLLACVPAMASRELKDELGRSVILPDNPQRVVCLSPSLTETVYALGLGASRGGCDRFYRLPAGGADETECGRLEPMPPWRKLFRFILTWCWAWLTQPGRDC